MKKRSTLFLATGLAAFLLVLVGAVAFSLTIKLIQPQGAEANSEWVNNANGTQGALTEPSPSPDTAGTSAATAQPEMITPERANGIALALVPGQLLQQAPELVNYQGRMAYQVRVSSDVVYIDAFSGDVLGQTAIGGAETVQVPASENQQNSSEQYEDADDDGGEYEDDEDDDGEYEDDEDDGGEHEDDEGDDDDEGHEDNDD